MLFKFKFQNFISLLKLHCHSTGTTTFSSSSAASSTLFNHQQWRNITKVRLNYAKNETLDHIIDKKTDLKSAVLLKDIIKRSPTSFITVKTNTDWQKKLGLNVPVLRFLRRYPTIFHEFSDPRYPNLPCFKLTDFAVLLDQQEQLVYENDEMGIVERLCKLLMMMKFNAVPLQSLYPLKWDLGLPDDFEYSIVSKYPDYFKVVKGRNRFPSLRLVRWRIEFAVSALQKSSSSSSENSNLGNDYSLAFPMNFPVCGGNQEKVRDWMEEFQKLPYFSPYDDSTRLDPTSELMEKRVVGLLHEFLSLTVHKMTKRNYLGNLREELNLPHRFSCIFTRYPGIFYLSLKCKTTTVMLKEGYQGGKLIDPHPLARIRDKFYRVMRTGILYRANGLSLLTPHDCLLDDAEGGNEDDCNMEEDESETDEECQEKEASSSDEQPQD